MCKCGLPIHNSDIFEHILLHPAHQDGQRSCPLCGMLFSGDGEGSLLCWAHCDDKHPWDGVDEKILCFVSTCKEESRDELHHRIHFAQVHLDKRHKAILLRLPRPHRHGSLLHPINVEHPQSHQHFQQPALSQHSQHRLLNSSNTEDSQYDPRNNPLILGLKTESYMIPIGQKFPRRKDDGQDRCGFIGPPDLEFWGHSLEDNTSEGQKPPYHDQGPGTPNNPLKRGRLIPDKESKRRHK
ncbi:hypothetical protein N431DRAFT_452634 [Stipitochalara longipes BDJ]|nr:hypothetical protein N431DRAFT_452634 [Stipitochalara longipes BDJ]